MCQLAQPWFPKGVKRPSEFTHRYTGPDSPARVADDRCVFTLAHGNESVRCWAQHTWDRCWAGCWARVEQSRASFIQQFLFQSRSWAKPCFIYTAIPLSEPELSKAVLYLYSNSSFGGIYIFYQFVAWNIKQPHLSHDSLFIHRTIKYRRFEKFLSPCFHNQ